MADDDDGRWGEEMECDIENQADQDADRVRLVPDPGQPNRREREAHTRTMQKLVYCMCAKKRSRDDTFPKHYSG